MLELFEPHHRRVKDERELGYYFSKYGEEAPAVLRDRAAEDGLSPRDRRHWQRLARKARRQRNQWMDKLTAS